MFLKNIFFDFNFTKSDQSKIGQIVGRIMRNLEKKKNVSHRACSLGGARPLPARVQHRIAPARPARLAGKFRVRAPPPSRDIIAVFSSNLAATPAARREEEVRSRLRTLAGDEHSQREPARAPDRGRDAAPPPPR